MVESVVLMHASILPVTIPLQRPAQRTMQKTWGIVLFPTLISSMCKEAWGDYIYICVFLPESLGLDLS